MTPPLDPCWTGDGWELCPRCHARYTYEEEVRCAACDGPHCPRCVVVVREGIELICPACHGPEGPSGPDAGNGGNV